MTTAQLQAYAKHVALRYGVNPTVFMRQISQESGWNPNARSSAGAQGIAQIMPSTAASWGVNPMNPRAALAAAARHDADYLRAYHGSYQKMLAAYNAGPGAVASGAWHGYSQTTNYVRSILSGVGNPHSFARGSAAAGAGGGGIARGGGGARGGRGNPAMLALLSNQQPISVTPMAPMQTAASKLQDLFAAQPASSGPASMPAVPSAAPGPDAFASQLDTTHSNLLRQL